jgi:hypothetical protein
MIDLSMVDPIRTHWTFNRQDKGLHEQKVVERETFPTCAMLLHHVVNSIDMFRGRRQCASGMRECMRLYGKLRVG